MYKITKEFRFEAAHILDSHAGACLNLHGHSYRLLITLSAKNAKNGMVLDFADLKIMVQKAIVDKIDHAFILNTSTTDGAEKEIAQVLEKHNRRVYKMQGRATAENMSRHFYEVLEPLMTRDYSLFSVTVFETPTSFCEYCK